jgi:hypothetical protein
VILAALLVAAQPDWDGAYGWGCSTPVAIEGYVGGLSRSYGRGAGLEPYFLQAQEPGSAPEGHSVTWTIYPLAEGPPARRRVTFLGGRREADAFVSGPDYVHIAFSWHTEVTGPVWAYYWGDGRYVGAEMLFSAGNVRRFRDRSGRLGGISGGLANRTLLAALADARSWTVVAADATGKRLFSETFSVPRWRAAEAEYRRARAALDRVEARFRVTHEPLSADGVSCADEDDPASMI